MTYQETLEYSKKITKQYGKNYYRATSLFPKKVREAVYLYYAWMRIPDEYVDSGSLSLDAEVQLKTWMKDWREAKQLDTTIHGFMKRCFEKDKVPHEYSNAFLSAMERDLHQTRYGTYGELESYMYGSAVVVGLTMLSFFGLHKEDLIPGATKLGEAMQLANFLRDVREDYDELGRIYLPQEDMNRFGVTEQDIAGHTMSDNFKNLMKFEIARCCDLYAQAWPAIKKLPWRLQFSIRIATRNYEGVLSEIEKAEYDIWSKRHSLSKTKKLLVIIKSLFV